MIDTSAFPLGGVTAARDTKACVDAAYPAWSGGMVTLPPNAVYKSMNTFKLGAYKYATGGGGFIAAKMAEYNVTYGGWGMKLGEWAEKGMAAAVEGEKTREGEGMKVRMCTQEQVRYGGFLLSKAEKEACWERCREVCLGMGVRAAAVGVECKSWGRGRGGLGKCWAGYVLDKRA